MKTRVIQTSIWRDILDEPMNIDTKLLYMYLLTNEHIGQTDYLKVIESEVSFYTGLDQKQIKFCLKQLEDVGLIRIYSNWVMFTNGAYIQSYYKGKKNEKAQKKELSAIPNDVLKFFSDTLSIPYQYTSDSTINNKSYILNNKSEIIKPKSTEKSYSEFNNVKLTDEDLNKLYEKIGKQNTDSLIEELGGYIAGHGKKYKSHYAVLQNWAKRRAVEAQAKKKVAFIDTSI
jgi:hypothetical protein